MADVKWIKIVTDIFDDDKIRYIESTPNGDETIVIWFKLLCLAGKTTTTGLLMMTDRIAYTDEMLASVFNRKHKSVMLALNLFEELEMIERFDNKILIANWNKHQTLDKIETKRIKDREYQKNKRNELKKSYDNRTTVVEQISDNRSLEEEEDKEKEKELFKDKDLRYIEDLNDDPIPPSETYDEMLGLIENEFKRTLSSSEINKFNDLFSKHGFKKIKYALFESVLYRKLSLAYMETCLNTWDKKGYTIDLLSQGVHKQ